MSANPETATTNEAKQSKNFSFVSNDGKNRKLWALPSTWSWSTIGQVTEVIRGASPRPKGDPRYFGGPIPWISIADLTRQPGKYLHHTREGVTKAGAALSRLIPAGDLILSNSATVCVPKILKVDGCIHDGFVAFPTLKEKVDLDFAYYWFEFVRPTMIQENRQGVTQVNLNTGIVREMHFPLAPRKEQRRIVEEIEKQFTRLEAGVAALRRVQANLKRYRAAVLNAACEGMLESVEVSASRLVDVRLADICESITDGDHQPPPKRPQGIPLLTIGNISSGKLDFSDTRFVPEGYYKQIKPNRIPRPNEILYSVVGATIGIPVLVNTDRLFCFSRHIALLKPSPKVLPRFLWLLMASPQTLREAWKRTTGSAQPTLALKPLRELPVKLPPITEQKRIVAEVERRLSVVEELESVVSANLQRATRLRQSILQRAFTGDLT